MQITSHHQPKPLQFGVKEMIKKTETVHQAPLQQQDKLTLQKEKSLEQTLTETRQLLELAKAKPFPFRKLTAANTALEKLKRQIQLSNEAATLKATHLKNIELMQAQTQQAKLKIEKLQEVSASSNSSEESLEVQEALDRFIEDLASPDVYIAEQAKEALISLGASEEKVSCLENLMLTAKKKQEGLKSGKNGLKFGTHGQTSPDDAIKTLAASIKSEILAKSDLNDIINTSVDYELSNMQHDLTTFHFNEPLFGRYYQHSNGTITWQPDWEPQPYNTRDLGSLPNP